MNRISLALALCAMLTVPAFASAHEDCGCHTHPVSAGCGCDAPLSHDCGCDTCATSCCDPCDPCRCDRPRKRLRLVRVSKEVCRRQRVCTTDCCGCPTSKTVRVRKCVTRLRLQRVEVAPRSRCNNACDPCGTTTACGCN